MSEVKSSLVEKHIRAWLQRFIVELNLCPFARPLIADPALRIHICDANNVDQDKDSASHFSNRSPYPLIHFLREEMVTAALENVDMPQQIPERNIALLEGMGRETVAARWNALTADDQT